jgi:osmotically-inducible protein OsmY
MKTDSELRQDVLNEFRRIPSIETAEIGVDTRDGIVTLSGNVDSHNKKWTAERTAARVIGVRAMSARIQVTYPGLSPAFRGLCR